MKFSWDENKRLATIADRGLDFIRARRFFDGRPVVHQPSPRNDEDRWKSTIEMEGAFYTVVWLWRGETRHVISMRRAHGQEIKKYHELHGG
jgi:uncharacterized protein